MDTPEFLLAIPTSCPDHPFAFGFIAVFISHFSLYLMIYLFIIFIFSFLAGYEVIHYRRYI